MAAHLRKVISKYRDIGLMEMMLIIAKNSLSSRVFDYRVFDIVGQDLQSVDPPPGPDLDIREAQLEDAPSLLAFGYSQEVCEWRFRNGFRARILTEQAKPVACDWLGLGEKRIRKWLCLKGGAGDIWNDFFMVIESHRGQGLGPRHRSHVVSVCRGAGYQRILGEADAENYRSLRALSKAGYRPLARCSFIRLWRLTCYLYQGRLMVGLWNDTSPLVIHVPEVAKNLRDSNQMG